MFAKLPLIALLIATPCIAQEGKPDTLALSDEDAETCKAGGCRTITDAAYALIAERLARAERVEELAISLSAQLKKKPNPKFCL